MKRNGWHIHENKYFVHCTEYANKRSTRNVKMYLVTRRCITTWLKSCILYFRINKRELKNLQNLERGGISSVFPFHLNFSPSFLSINPIIAWIWITMEDKTLLIKCKTPSSLKKAKMLNNNPWNWDIHHFTNRNDINLIVSMNLCESMSNCRRLFHCHV